MIYKHFQTDGEHGSIEDALILKQEYDDAIKAGDCAGPEYLFPPGTKGILFVGDIPIPDTSTLPAVLVNG